MQKFHEWLEKQSPVYANWHRSPNSSVTHWFILGAASLVVVLASANLYDLEYMSSSAQMPHSDLGAMTTRLLQASSKFEQTPASEKSQALPALTALVSQRRAELLSEMQNNPAQAFMHSLPTDLIQQLPADIRSSLEQHQVLTGTLEGLHIHRGPDLEHQTSEDIFTLKEKATGKIYHLNFVDGQPDAEYFNSTVTASGVVLDDQMLVTEVTGQVLSPVIGNQKVLVIMYKYLDTSPTATLATVDQMNSLVFTSSTSTAAFYNETSYGQMTMSGDVAGWYTVPFSSNCSDSSSWSNAADAAATAAGYNLDNYAKIVYVNAPGSCNIISSAEINGKRAWISGGYWTYMQLYAHELGHTFGLYHANSLNCGLKAIDIYNNCLSGEYRDRSDVMGGGNTNIGEPMQFNAPHKEQLGWLAPAQTQTITSSGTYTVNRLETGESNVKTLKIAKPDTEDTYYISYRQPVGAFDSRFAFLPSLFQGANIHIWGPDNVYKKIIGTGHGSLYTYLIDNVPGDFETYDAALVDGGVFSDPINGVVVTQLNHDTNSTAVSVQFGTPTCGRIRPEIVLGTFDFTKWGAAGQTANYNMTVTNLDSQACGSSSFNLSAAVPAGWSGSVTPTSVTLAPHASINVTGTITSATTALDGDYGIAFSVTKATDSSQTNSANAIYHVYTPVTPPDLVAPFVNITSPANGATLKGASATIKATASDNIGVTKMELYIDGILTTTQTTSLSYKWSTKQVSKGLHTILVKAFDAAGNVGTKQITVTK